MKRFLTAVIVPAIMITFHSCAGEKKAKITDQDVEKTVVDPTAQPPGQYKIDFSPTTIVLGEYREIFVRLTNGKITQPDTQQDTSRPLQISFTLSVTNKSTPTNKRFFFLSRSDAFVELSDGQVLPMTTGEGFASPDPATSNTICWTILIPKKVTPLRLLLYHEKKKVAIKLAITEEKFSL